MSLLYVQTNSELPSLLTSLSSTEEEPKPRWSPWWRCWPFSTQQSPKTWWRSWIHSRSTFVPIWSILHRFILFFILCKWTLNNLKLIWGLCCFYGIYITADTCLHISYASIMSTALLHDHLLSLPSQPWVFLEVSKQ